MATLATIYPADIESFTVLKKSSDVLNEVVVIGYGTMDKKELTSAIFTC